MIRVGIADFKGRQLLNDRYKPEWEAVTAEDVVLVAHRKGFEIAWMAARPMIWVHSLTVNPALPHRPQTHGVEALFQYGFGWGFAAPRLAAGCLFQTSTSNVRMEAVANSLGGVEEEDSRIWRLDR